MKKLLNKFKTTFLYELLLIIYLHFFVPAEKKSCMHDFKTNRFVKYRNGKSGQFVKHYTKCTLCGLKRIFVSKY